MGCLSGTKCYLVGPVEHDQSFGKDWREVAVEKLENLGIRIYNPLDRPDWMKHIQPYIPMSVSRGEVLEAIGYNDSISEKFIVAQQFIRHICLRYVNSCDFVLCYLPNAKTFGSTEELVVAGNSKKPMIVVCPDDVPSLWIYDIIKDDYIFKNLDDAFLKIYDIDDGNETLDPLKWIFLENYPKLKLEKKYVW